MHANVGTLDQILRLIAGITLIALALVGRIGPWGYIGILIAVTGLVRYCPAYSLFGWSTCAAAKKP